MVSSKTNHNGIIKAWKNNTHRSEKLGHLELIPIAMVYSILVMVMAIPCTWVLWRVRSVFSSDWRKVIKRCCISLECNLTIF